jgi:Putative porin
MLARKFVFIPLIAGFIFGTMSILHAQDAGALLDLLVKKRLITDQEAEEVRAELTKEVSATPGGKWKLSSPITELELYGDLRMRYEYRAGRTADDTPQPAVAPGNGLGGPNDWQERKRERYRLRLGLRGTLADDWFFGIRLETSTNPRSTNVTFGDDSGPFGKTSDAINVGQVYLGYKGFKDITLIAGKMPQPLVTTLMTWDGDINPEGLAQQWKHSFNLEFGGGTAEAAQPSPDGKGVVAPSPAGEPFKLKIDVFANFAQFVYDDSNPENPLGRRAVTGGNGGTQLVPNTDAFLLAWQVGARFNFPKTLYAQVAPTLYNYTGNGDTFNTHYRGGEAAPFTNAASLGTNQTGINSLLVFDMPWEIGWKLGELPMRLFGDFAVNLAADDRAFAAGHPGKDDQRYAYQVGIGIGQLKAKRDWQVNVFWQHTEQYSLDPNLVDSDIFDSRVNMEGIAVQAGYMLSDALVFNLLYAHAWPSDDHLGTGGVGDIGINPLSEYDIFQADLSVKF